MKSRKTTRKTSRKTSRKITRKPSKKGGVKILSLATLGLGLSALGTACGDRQIMTACAGNTCRSPVAEHLIGNTLDNVAVFSRGVNVRTPGASMAPYSDNFAKAYCDYGDLECLKGVETHQSKAFECGEIEQRIANHDNTLQIIPMDDSVAEKIHIGLETCALTPAQRGRIKVGLDCASGVCKKTSAQVKDPFFDKGTPKEREAYKTMEEQISDMISDEFKVCLLKGSKPYEQELDEF